MSNLPPPYYATAADLKAEQRDLASVIRQSPEALLSTDQYLYQISALLKDNDAPAGFQDEWHGFRRSFVSLIWTARETAGKVEARNQDFTESFIPLIFDADVEKEDKVAELQNFIQTSEPPELLTSTEAVDTLRKIEAGISDIVQKYEHQEDVSTKATELKNAWTSVPYQVRGCLLDAWTHLTNDAIHLKNRLDGSTSDPLPDSSTITQAYKEVNEALRLYTTTVVT
ncbi:hypothetical protein FRC07_003285 [Ceratobasidium sp. 392]|nr:hypothetical protein FRC07_003285 [Ceratobasidium sp. 392]